ncbi:PEP/pyruvate-binding domain-containing protein [Nocardia flavorosea]|uniref:Pyruvate, phosphate dikinase n=2 Tax=Nocardia flavorosea TaxID=53429 RepID=A0A846YSX9_9NOCA|nr:PEP/pyruvate-binding domain-containing protein [Nocardia flavorosea]NKY60089.1 pyruvate, phosphate dikinase [Nocardia flavorosea]
MLIPLFCATRSHCGSKAGTLGVLLHHGLPVPDGFVVPSTGEAAAGPALHSAVARELDLLGNPVLAVRSSAATEDTADASAAGQYESVIGVQGVDAVCAAITACRASAHAARVGDYRRRTNGHTADAAHGMAVLVQRVVEADVSGVLFTPTQPGDPIRVEASWGLGLAVVDGIVTPDTYEVAPDGKATCTTGSKQIRIDLHTETAGVTTSAVADERQTARTLDDRMATVLAGLGNRIAGFLGGPQDIEWAVADGKVWILQARPITAVPPAFAAPAPDIHTETLSGTPGSHGTVTATARVVHGPADFVAVRPGEVVVCPYTDPAWTPLFTIATGVVTETGGALSHAAIVAREYGIPAVLGVANATKRIETGDPITLDGTAGSVTILPS